MDKDSLPEVRNVFDVDIDQSALKEAGLEGLLFDHGSFPTMTLRAKQFELSNYPEFDDKSFDVQIIKTMPKFILIDEKDRDFTEVKYSRNGTHTVEGEALEFYMTKMAEDGRVPKLKRYLDIVVRMVNRGDILIEEIVVLSISPTSVGAISGFLMQLGVEFKDKVVNVHRGIIKTSKSGHTYALWGMKVKI
jgi:hypothetical protein